MKLLIKPNSSKQFINDNYKQVFFKTGYNTDYQFTMMLPQSWKTYPATTAQYPTETVPISRIGKAVSTDEDYQAEIDMWCTLIPRELNPSDWLFRWLETQEYELQDSRTLTTGYGFLGDCVAYKQINGKRHTCRLFTLKDKNRIFLFIGRTYAESYKQHEETFLLAIQTLSLLNPTKELYAEPFKEKFIKTPFETRLRFPLSWVEQVEKPESKDEMSLSLINKDGDITLGQINIVILTSTLNLSASDLLSTWLAKLKANGIYTKEDIPAAEAIKGKNKTITSWQNLAEAENHPIELQSNIIEHEKGVLMLNLITPPAAEDYETWAMNRRIYEVLYNTISYE